MKLLELATMIGRSEKHVRNQANFLGIPRQTKTRQLTSGDTLLLLVAHELSLRGIKGQMLESLLRKIPRDIDDLFLSESGKSFLVVAPSETEPGRFDFICLPSAEAAIYHADTFAGSRVIPLHGLVRSAIARMAEHKSTADTNTPEVAGYA